MTRRQQTTAVSHSMRVMRHLSSSQTYRPTVTCPWPVFVTFVAKHNLITGNPKVIWEKPRRRPSRKECY